MHPDKTITRQRLDKRLLGLGLAVGPPPLSGWLREIRLALSMSTAELGQRMAISQQRASRLERAELDGTIRLATLKQAAKALNCSLFYVLVPDEALEETVVRQAHRKATEELQEASVPIDEDADEWLEVRTLELVDRRGLWLQGLPQCR